MVHISTLVAPGNTIIMLPKFKEKKTERKTSRWNLLHTHTTENCWATKNYMEFKGKVPKKAFTKIAEWKINDKKHSLFEKVTNKTNWWNDEKNIRKEGKKSLWNNIVESKKKVNFINFPFCRVDNSCVVKKRHRLDGDFVTQHPDIFFCNSSIVEKCWLIFYFVCVGFAENFAFTIQSQISWCISSYEQTTFYVI